MENFDLFDVLISMAWFAILATWIWMFVAILRDIIGDRELGGAKKALWTLFIVLLPWIGAICYMLVRGDSMNARTERAQLERAARERADTAPAASSSPSVAEDLRELAKLRDTGSITPTEYERAKAKMLA